MEFKEEFVWLRPDRKVEPLFYFVGGENGRELLDILCRNSGARNVKDFIGDDSSSVYFDFDGEISAMDKKMFEYLKKFGLDTKEIKAPKYEKFNNIFSLTAAELLDTPMYIKINGRYRKCKIMDMDFVTSEGSKRIVLKVEKGDGYEIIYLPADLKELKKAELYFKK